MGEINLTQEESQFKQSQAAKAFNQYISSQQKYRKVRKLLYYSFRNYYTFFLHMLGT